MPASKKKHLSPSEKAVKAAKTFLAPRQSGRNNAPPRPSMRALAVKYNTTHTSIRRAIQRNLQPQPMGRKAILNDEEESALCGYVVFLERTGFPATRGDVLDAATELRRRRHPDAPVVGKDWYTRFRKRHPELETRYLKAVERARIAWELSDAGEIEGWFNNLKSIIQEYQINASDCWNEDECGIQIGCLAERVKVLVTYTTRASRPQVLDPSNRETSTLIGCANAVGDSLPPWLIFKTLPTTRFADIDADEGMRFAKSDTGYSNAEITLEWLHDFNKHSWTRSSQAKRSGKSLSDHFGCDEWLRDHKLPWIKHDSPPRDIPKEERFYRLLIVDGFTGHTSFKCYEYCVKFDIIIAFLPAHSSHILQPLDVGVFQYLKKAQQNAIKKHLREGNTALTRYDFVSAFQEIFLKGFQIHHIISGFEKSGLWPTSEKPALTRLAKKRHRNKLHLTPELTALLPDELRFTKSADIIQQIEEKYSNLLSSPTRKNLQIVRSVLNEATLMDRERQQFVDNREKRIIKYANRKKPGRAVKPQGGFVTSVSLEELRQQEAEMVAKERTASQRREIRMHRSSLKREIEAIELSGGRNVTAGSQQEGKLLQKSVGLRNILKSGLTSFLLIHNDHDSHSFLTKRLTAS